jgi:transcriptional regulator with XRE-family HTH domain
MSGVSISFISDLTNGKSNPSFRIMERIADALDGPLPALLRKIDLDSQLLKTLVVGKPRDITEGYERVSLILPSHQTYVAK